MNELKQVLREVLKEELKPIISRLDGVDTQLSGQKEQLATVMVQLNRLEQTQQDDVLGLLQLIESRFLQKVESDEDQKHGIKLLNDRLFKIESEVQKLAAR